MLSAISLLLLVVGVVFRNLAKEDIQHFRGFKWRLKYGKRFVLIKHMLWRMTVILVAVLGPEDAWYPPFICFLLCIAYIVYFLRELPYVEAKYNCIRMALYAVTMWSFFVAFINNANDDEGNAGMAVLFFLFPIIAIAAYFGTRWRCSKVRYIDTHTNPDKFSAKDDPLSHAEK